MPECLHCSTPVVGDAKFCCNGCASVYEIIHANGLSQFYDLKENAKLTPLNERPFTQKDWAWISQKREQETEDVTRYLFGISGLSCVACVWLVEASAKKHAGILQCNVSTSDGSCELIIDKDCELESLADELYKLGYELFPSPKEKQSYSNLAIPLGVCAALAMNCMAFTLPRYTGMDTSDEMSHLFTLIIIASSTLSLVVGGSHFIKRAWLGLKMKSIHMDLPIALGLLLAYAGSLVGWLYNAEKLFYFDFVAIFTFLMLLGRYVQNTSLNKMKARFQVADSIPDSYTTSDGNVLSLEEISKGEQLTLTAGELVPAVSRVENQSAEFSLAWITGEPESIVYEVGDIVPAGAISQSNKVTLEVHEPVDLDAFFYQLPQQRDFLPPSMARLVSIYLYSVLLVGIIAGISWFILTQDLVKSIQVIISVYVVSCPCGIGLALPLLDQKCSKFANDNGVFVLSSTLWNKLNKISHIVFDKTGTLSLDRPQLKQAEELKNINDDQKFILFSLCKSSLHPLSRSIFCEFVKLGFTKSLDDLEITEKVGVGLFCKWNNHSYALKKIEKKDSELSCGFYKNDKLLHTFEFIERARDASAKVIPLIESWTGTPVTILSGDHKTSVANMAKHLKITNYHAELTPEEKERNISRLQEDGSVFYLGDGINDIPAIREAHLSAAPFANINLLTNEVDVVYTDETLSFIPALASLAKLHRRLSHRVICYTILYNIAVVTFAAVGLMSPLVAAVVMPLSSLISLLLITDKVTAKPLDQPTASSYKLKKISP